MLGVIVAVDAAIATPLGLTLLYFVPIVLAARWLQRRGEVVAMACVSTASRVLFGPLSDPLGLRPLTIHVSSDVQAVVAATTSLVGYVSVAFLLGTVFRQRSSLRELRAASETDPLTGLANRRALDAVLAARAGVEASVVAVDLDHFKRINDTRGHAAGDAVLVELARRLRVAVRESDVVGRVGGEEFVLILPGAPLEVSERVAQRIVDSIRSEPFIVPGGALEVTASVGVAMGPLGPGTLEAADRALYDAKAGGRDRVVLAGLTR